MGNNKFLIRLLVFTLALAIPVFLVQQKYDISPVIWLALGYFALLTLVVYRIAVSGLKKDNKTFMVRVNGAIGIRFLFSVFPLAIYLFFSPRKEIPLLFCYLFLYFFYTAFEIYHLVVNLRPDSNKKQH
jgi:hypothetical protein